MKKNILVLAISTAFAIPAAMADVAIGPVAIYGTLNSAVEVISVDNVNTSIAKTAESQARLADQTSKLGFKANDVQGSTVTETGAQQFALATTYQIHKYVTAIGSFTRVSNDRNANFTSASG